MSSHQQKTYLEEVLDEALKEYSKITVLRLVYSVGIILCSWWMVAFFLWIVFIEVPSITGMRNFFYDCLEYVGSQACTTKGWVSFILNLVSFLITIITLFTPRPDFKP